ncbi:MAG: hypothetical protein H6672_22985 [Anaerolineaceae bacterium]|nr:hypothetical protein [Anaerolineaceae bacterium]
MQITMPFVLSVASTLVSAVFTVFVLRRWWEKRRPHLLAWGVGLILYTLGTLCQVILSLTWSPFLFLLWYWAGAIMVAPWLGQGTIFLLVRKGNIARNIAMLLVLITVMTLPWALLLTNVDGSQWTAGQDMTKLLTETTIMPKGGVRILTPIMNIWGTLTLVGGALYSARLFRRKQILRNRMIGNWLIAAGGLLPALGGTLLDLGDASFKYIGELAGVILIFAGFLLATQAAQDAIQSRRNAAQSPQTQEQSA